MCVQTELPWYGIESRKTQYGGREKGEKRQMWKGWKERFERREKAIEGGREGEIKKDWEGERKTGREGGMRGRENHRGRKGRIQWSDCSRKSAPSTLSQKHFNRDTVTSWCWCFSFVFFNQAIVAFALVVGGGRSRETWELRTITYVTERALNPTRQGSHQGIRPGHGSQWGSCGSVRTGRGGDRPTVWPVMKVQSEDPATQGC